MKTEENILNKLKKAIKDDGSQAAYAERLGLSEQYISDVVRGKRSIGGRILKDLNYTKITRYVEITPMNFEDIRK